ncbi:MAG: hypothetical protein J5982_05675 [Bacilli bacterium]|nr:hypothetical protein [Bacilli bacterium]
MNKKSKIILISILGVLILLVIILLVLLLSSNKIRELEKIKIEEVSKDTLKYLEDYNISEKKYDKYILYALEYSYNENGITELSYEEIIEIVSKRFNVEIKPEILDSMGITELLVENFVTINNEGKYELIRKHMTQSYIAEIPVVEYKIDKIKRKDKKYIVTYDKYVINNAYDVLNYYSQNKPDYDTTKIYNYLTCKGLLKDVKETITDEVLENIGKKEKGIKVTYIIDNDNLLVDKIEES